MRTCSRPRRMTVAGVCVLLACALTPAVGQDRADNYPFEIAWDGGARGALDLRERLDWRPVAEAGRVAARGDRLVFEDGSSARLWGIGLSASRSFPPATRADADALVERLARFGFNVARIRAIDAHRVGLYEQWLATGRLDSGWMARLDYFLWKLAEAGIYHSLGTNVEGTRHLVRAGREPTEHARAHKRYNGVQLFDEAAIADTLRWYEAVLSHVNPHTGKSLAEDPAHAYFPVVAEDSIYNHYFLERDELGESASEELRRLFNEHLRASYPSRDALAKSWSEDARNALGDAEDPWAGTVYLGPRAGAAGAGSARQRDLMRFFMELDRAYYRRTADTVRALGYRGLLTGTNNWFGPANLYVNHAVGDYIDTQAYFDHPAKVRGDLGRTIESVSNASQLAGYPHPGRRKSVHHGSFHRLFASALTDRPLVVSEWNHSGWSDYAYEGPLMMTAYGSLQGYPALVLHTYASTGAGLRQTHATRALAWTGNPVLQALTPSLALAFRRGDIQESKTTVVVPLADDETALLDRVAEQGLGRTPGDGSVPADTGFVHRLRVAMPGTKPAGPATAGIDGALRLASDTGEIVWNRDPRAAWLRIDGLRFEAFGGRTPSGGIELGAARLELEQHGAVTLVSLDGAPLEQSRELLVTAVSSFENSGAEIDIERSASGKVKRKIAEDPGEGPPLMRRTRGVLTVQTCQPGTPRVVSLGPAGEETAVPSTVRDADTRRDIVLELGDEDSPWYLIRF